MIDLHGNFRDQVLEQIAKGLGLTQEQMSQDYEATLSPWEREARAAAKRFWRREQEMWAWYDAIYHTYLAEALLSIFIAGPGVEHVVGYNPQRLLTYQPGDS